MSDITVKDYGDILAFRYEGEKVYYKTDNYYHGKYVAVIKTKKIIESYDDIKINQYYVFVGEYGSCSSCDWLEAEGDYNIDDYDGEKYPYKIDVKLALEYSNQSIPIFILPKKPTEEWVNKLVDKVTGEINK